ncbi:MAG TPA: Flp family type IVb pilin [Clostridia bacterium]|nr:Flp family type IVb pilin [Clostridia bacterium]
MMRVWMDYGKALLNKKKGQGMVEYGLIIGLIAVVVIGALVILGPKIANLFTQVSNKL